MCKRDRDIFAVSGSPVKREGGACVNDDILIQGDMRERLADELRTQGYTVKTSGA